MATDPNRPLKVFLCHAHSDRDAVKALYARLKREGVDVWLDKEKLLPGADWEYEIRKAVREADVVVVCLSKQFNQDGFRQKEVRIALDAAMEKREGEIFIIPARLEECDNLDSLRKWHWVDLFESDGFQRLIMALRVRAGKIGATLRQRGATAKKSDAEKELQRLAKEKANREEADRIAREKARLDAEEKERQRLAKEKTDREAAEKLAREKADRDAVEKARLDAEEQERQKLAKADREEADRIAREKADREAIEKARLEAEEKERQRLAKEQADREEADRIAREKADRDAIEKARLDAEEKERQRLAKEKADREEADRIAREKADRDAIEKARLDAEEKERQRLAKEKADREETDRIAHEKADRDAVAKTRTFTEELKKKNAVTANQPKKNKLNIVTVVALLGLAGIIGIALISSPMLKTLFAPAPTATLVFTPTATKPPAPSVTPTKVFTPTKAFTPTATSLPDEITDHGAVMRLVPAGEFTMGSENGDNDEKPVHQVYLDSFYMDKYEVTNALYKTCVDTGGCTPPQNTSSYTRSNYYGNSVFDDYPVIYVDWNQAKAYCKWRGAGLPTEAQWEKAARGTDGRTYPWGEGIDASHANYNKSDTAQVGSYESGKSPYGIYDMAGNVWEWVNDWYDGAYYQGSPSSNPLGPSLGQYRVLRGGSWNLNKNLVRSTYRLNATPVFILVNFGFRCARSLP